MGAMASEEDRIFDVYTAADGLSDNCAHTIHCTRTGRMVINTRGQINFYDGQRFSYIDPSDENFYPLADYHGHYHYYFDNKHHFWLKDNGVLACVNLTKEKFETSVENVLKEMGVTEPISDFFVDKLGTLWVLTEKGFFNVSTKKTFPVRKGLNLQDMEVINGSLLLFYNNGLLEMYDVERGKRFYEGFAYDEKDIPTFDKTSVFYTAGDTIYHIRNGNKQGVLNRFIIKQREWKEILRVPYHLNNVTKRDSLLYVPCEYGYWTCNVNNGKTKQYKGLRLNNGRVMETNLNVICFDRQGGMWAGTEQKGLLFSRPFPSPFHVYSWDERQAKELASHLEEKEERISFRGKNVNCMFKDSRGWTWVGTAQGLQCYRSDTDNLPTVYTKRDGFLNNMIHSIVEDQLHNIWVGTSNGVACLLMENNELDYILIYDSFDYIPNESFVNGKAVCLPDGSIVMQTVDHVVEFNPTKMKTLKRGYDFDLYPKLIRLMVNGVNVWTGDEIDGNVILDKAISRVHEINLNYDQNSISLAFSALNFFRPTQTAYRVRVKGLIDEWRVLTTWNSGGLVDKRGVLHLPMMSLKPGSYKIELQASIEPNVWETTPYEWTVNVNEPWWRTSGMVTIVSLVLLLLLFANAYYYLKNNKLRVELSSGGAGVLKRICNFVARSNLSNIGEQLEVTTDEVMGNSDDPNMDLSPEFVNVIKKIMPYIESADQSKLTMRELSDKADMDVQQFYSVMTNNIYKSPLLLARRLMLDKAEVLLKTTDKSIAAIAKDCAFASPNYFIALFFRRHHMTPEEFRKK